VNGTLEYGIPGVYDEICDEVPDNFDTLVVLGGFHDLGGRRSI
jgi:hypothetical protein